MDRVHRVSSHKPKRGKENVVQPLYLPVRAACLEQRRSDQRESLRPDQSKGEGKNYASGVSSQVLIKEKGHHGCKHWELPPTATKA
eukprot:441350-Pelagomonas_calceolata.AAC.1